MVIHKDFLRNFRCINLQSCGSTTNIRKKYITSRSIDHLATTTTAEASRKRAAIITPLSPEPGKTCCSRQSGSCHAKTPQDQHTRTTTAADEGNHRSEGSNLKTHEHRRTKTRSEQIHQRQPPTESYGIHWRHTSTCSSIMLGAPPGQWQGEPFTSLGSRQCLAFLSMAQTLTKFKETYKNGALPSSRVGIHCTSMVLKTQETRQIGGAADGRKETQPHFLLG